VKIDAQIIDVNVPQMLKNGCRELKKTETEVEEEER